MLVQRLLIAFFIDKALATKPCGPKCFSVLVKRKSLEKARFLHPRKKYHENYFMFECLRGLNMEIGDEFKEKLKRKFGEKLVPCFVALFSLGHLKFNEVEEEVKQGVVDYIKSHNVKVNNITLPFLSNHVKRRMFVFLCCLKRLYIIGKDLTLMLLDHVWGDEMLRGYGWRKVFLGQNEF